MDRILVVDGSNLLFQMFFGMPARIVNHQGKAIQGTLGFVGAVLKMIRMTCPTHVAVLFDGECDNGRSALDPDYKANRTDYSQVAEEDSPFSQLPDIYRALDWMGIPHAETTCCETDDWMAAYARACPPDWEVVLASQDSDLFQLIDHRVRLLRYRGDKSVLWDSTAVWEKFGVRPELYAQFKALTGDHSDNLKGAPKVGPKTAAALLAQFGSLERLLSHPEQIARPALRASIENSTQRLRTNYALIRLEGHFPLPFPPEDLAFSGGPFTTAQVLRAIGLKE